MVESLANNIEKPEPKEIAVISRAIARLNVCLKEENHDSMLWGVRSTFRARDREVQYMDILEKLDDWPLDSDRKQKRLRKAAYFLINIIDKDRVLRRRTMLNFPPLQNR